MHESPPLKLQSNNFRESKLIKYRMERRQNLFPLDSKTRQMDIPILQESKKERKNNYVYAFSPNRLDNKPSKINQTFILIKSNVSDPFQTNFQNSNTFAHGSNIQVSSQDKSKTSSIHEIPPLHQSIDNRNSRLFKHPTERRQKFFPLEPKTRQMDIQIFQDSKTFKSWFVYNPTVHPSEYKQLQMVTSPTSNIRNFLLINPNVKNQDPPNFLKSHNVKFSNALQKVKTNTLKPFLNFDNEYLYRKIPFKSVNSDSSTFTYSKEFPLVQSSTGTSYSKTVNNADYTN